jgi:hypothetical protein
MMFRALVLLLILPPMLLPPGMCVCQFIPVGKASTAPVSAPPSRQTSLGHNTDPQPDCTCDSCRHARTAPTVPEGENEQAIRTPADGPSNPGPGKHLPCCPAAVVDVPLNVAVITVTTQVDLVVTAGFFTPVAETVVSPGRVAPVPPPVGSPALFISHCALLI